MTKKIMVGVVPVGGGAPVSIQSMCSTKTDDVSATVDQILRLEEAGCEIVRVAVPDMAAARAVGRARGIGTVDVYVAGENGLPSQELLEELNGVFREKREIAVDVEVKAPRVRTVDVCVAAAPREGADREAVLEAVSKAAADYFGGRLLGRPVRLLWTDRQTEAEAVDIDGQFGLVVRLPDGSLTTVRTGEVSVRGLYGYVE